jgi:hypothetical protein
LRYVQTIECEADAAFVVVAGLPDQNMMGQVDTKSSFLDLVIRRAVSLDEDMLVGPVIGSRLGLTFNAIGISRLVEGLEDRRYCTSESARSFFDMAVAS